jgi:hypothetical protein
MPRHIPDGASPLDLRPEKWRPSEERQAEMDAYLWDREMMRVYCDCSVSRPLKAFGLGVAIVFDGSVIVRSRKAYDRTMQLLPTHGELQALGYAIEQTSVMLKDVMNVPMHLFVYSDVDHVQQIVHGGDIETFADSARRIAAARTRLERTWPSVELNLCYLPPDEQKHNPYYAAAHNAARREVSMKKR